MGLETYVQGNTGDTLRVVIREGNALRARTDTTRKGNDGLIGVVMASNLRESGPTVPKTKETILSIVRNA